MAILPLLAPRRRRVIALAQQTSASQGARLPARATTTSAGDRFVDEQGQIALRGGPAAARQQGCRRRLAGELLSPAGVDCRSTAAWRSGLPGSSPTKLPAPAGAALERLWRGWGSRRIWPKPWWTLRGGSPLRQALAVPWGKAPRPSTGRALPAAGAHLEGPFLATAPPRRPPEQHLCPPSWRRSSKPDIGGFEDSIDLVHPGPGTPRRRRRDRGPSVPGHRVSLVTAPPTEAEARAALPQGVSMLTPQPSTRCPACTTGRRVRFGAALRRRRHQPRAESPMGWHVKPPTVAVLLQGGLAPRHVVLVSDALAP